MSPHTFEGPRWYRGRIRARGPLAALAPPTAMGLVAVLLLNLGGTSATGVSGLVLGVMAAPALLAVGAPISSNSLIPIGIGISVVLWLVVGVLAARRATRYPMATWADFWRAYAVMAAGIFVGAGTALVVARAAVGDALL